MDDTSVKAPTAGEPVGRGAASSRRGFLGALTVTLGGLIGLVLAVPGAAYVLSPLRKRLRDGESRALTRLKALEVGVPKSFAIIEERQDAWVKYPAEPVGSVWLIRQEDGTDPPVIAFTAECPHLGCAINLMADGKGFLCPCHTSAFDLDGKPRNRVPPRSMDRLEVEMSPGEDPEVRVKFRRFRAQAEEKIPLV
jgi:menaquinol-cytochrome c reductase iron-sulfur subunit